MSRKSLFLTALALAALSAPALADPVKVVAAENFYGDVAAQIGGADVAVTSILTNPDQDPHLFEASTETAKALAADLVAVDPAHEADYEKGEASFLDSLKPLDAKIADLRKLFAGQPVTASEPVFGYQAGLIGLQVHNEKFAWAVMNNAEPSASQVAAFEDDLKGHKVKVMLFNAQASEPAVRRLVELAKSNAIPVVGVSETEPPGANYQTWMMSQLDALDRALSGGGK